MPAFCRDILETVGDTPVLPVASFTDPARDAALYAKYEAGNPSSSLKDRLALRLVEKYERLGRLNRGSVVVAATAGNTGVALALVCAVKHYRLHLFMPEDTSPEKRDLFAHFGAEVHLTPLEKGVSGARFAALDFAAARQKALFLNQFDDEAVARSHEETTAVEILRDFPDGVDAFVMGVGTGGTITGVGKILKDKKHSTLVVAVEPESSAVLSGGPPGRSLIQQLGLGFVPPNLRRELIDRVVRVSDREAYEATCLLARREGVLAGLSTGANLVAAAAVARELGKGKTVLTVICDQGQRYFSLRAYFSESKGRTS